MNSPSLLPTESQSKRICNLFSCRRTIDLYYTPFIIFMNNTIFFPFIQFIVLKILKTPYPYKKEAKTKSRSPIKKRPPFLGKTVFCFLPFFSKATTSTLHSMKKNFRLSLFYLKQRRAFFELLVLRRNYPFFPA